MWMALSPCAFSIRVSECGWPLLRGVQDQLASAYGGVNFMEVEYPNARIFPIHLDPSVICEVEDRLVLIYTGKSHFRVGCTRR